MFSEKIVLEPTLLFSDFSARAGISNPMAIGSEELKEEALTLFECCAALVRPKALVRETGVKVLDDTRVMLDGEAFESRCLAVNLAGLERTFAYVATCGNELEEQAAGGDGLRAYWVDIVKELALESVVDEMNRRVASRYPSEGVATMNPGSADIDVWPIEQQAGLFRLLGETYTEVGVRLTDSLVMIPNKSLSGVLFPSRAGWVSCEMCTRGGCIGRRAPYRGHADPDIDRRPITRDGNRERSVQERKL